jgi:SAM-dependent methyltransferase
MGHECVGLDFSERMLGVARQRAADLKLDCAFIFGDAEAPPLPDDTFDVVSSRHLLFNLPHPGVAIRHWVRVLKPGGRMILIGNEHLQQPPQSLAARSKQFLRSCLGRPARRRVPGWNPGPDYLDAVSQCPLFKHGEGTLRAGLQDIQSIATDDVDSARRQDPKKYLRRDFPSRFFILVGIKP